MLRFFLSPGCLTFKALYMYIYIYILFLNKKKQKQTSQTINIKSVDLIIKKGVLILYVLAWTFL